MRIPLLLCFGLAALLCSVTARADYTGAQVQNAGKIAGSVTLAGPRPSLPAKPRDRSPDVCGASGPDESLVVGENGGVANAVVYLADIHAGKPLEPQTASLDQKGCTYIPHLLAVPVGSTVNMLNSDPLLHNLDVQGPTSFNYAMPMTTKKIPKKFTKPGFLTVKCDVHPWMSGVLAVMETPYFAVTGPDGKFAIDDVPPGTYSVEIWHEGLHASPSSVTVRGGATSPVAFKLK